MLPILFLLLATSSSASNVKGSFTVNAAETKPSYIYAIARPDPFDQSKEGVEVLFATKPVPAKDLSELFPGEGARLLASIGADGTPRGVVLLYEGRQLSTSRNGIAFVKTTMDGSRIAGRISSQKQLDLGSSKNALKLRFDITFDAPILREKQGKPPL